MAALKIDENLPAEVAESFRAAGHDACTVFDQRLVGEPDPCIAKVCRAERRILVTLDTDFSDIRLYPPSDYFGIVVLRVARQDKPYVLSLIERLIAVFDAHGSHAGSLWIVDESSIRVRR